MLWPPVPGEATMPEAMLARRRAQEAERQRQYYQQKILQEQAMQRNQEKIRCVCSISVLRNS